MTRAEYLLENDWQIDTTHSVYHWLRDDMPGYIFDLYTAVEKQLLLDDQAGKPEVEFEE